MFGGRFRYLSSDYSTINIASSSFLSFPQTYCDPKSFAWQHEVVFHNGKLDDSRDIMRKK